MEPIAAAYHWQPETMLDLDVDELVRWADMASARLQVSEQATAAHLARFMARMFGAR